MHNCPHCGERLPPVVDAYCPDCRESLTEPAPSAPSEPPPTTPEPAERGMPSLALKLLFWGVCCFGAGVIALTRVEVVEGLAFLLGGVLLFGTGLAWMDTNPGQR
jgi:hypothetical protein